MNSLKTKIHSACLELVNEKILSIQRALNDLRAAAENDSKSSAGDKHETSRAMAQIEQERLGKQLQEALIQKNALDRINTESHTDSIRLGSLIKTEKGFFYLSVALGKLEVNGIGIMVLSPQSPLGQKMLGAKTKNTIEMNNIKYLIENVS